MIRLIFQVSRFEVKIVAHSFLVEFTFKNFTYDLESKNKAQFERAEWINVKFHSLYDPEQAFELIIEWMVATGNAIPEIVSQWGRAKNTGLHIGNRSLFLAQNLTIRIVPIPWDPFALPFSSRSDPLRGPIYLSLNIDCLPPNILEGMCRKSLKFCFVSQTRIQASSCLTFKRKS